MMKKVLLMILALQISPLVSFAEPVKDMPEGFKKGLYLDSIKKYDEAISEYTKVIEANPHEAAFGYGLRGNTYMAKSDFKLAVSDYSKAIELNPKWSTPYVGRGYTYRCMGDFERAIADYSNAVEISPTFALAYHERAIVYFLKKDYDKSWEDVNEAKKLGLKVSNEFLQKLKRASGREK